MDSPENKPDEFSEHDDKRGSRSVRIIIVAALIVIGVVAFFVIKNMNSDVDAFSMSALTGSTAHVLTQLQL